MDHGRPSGLPDWGALCVSGGAGTLAGVLPVARPVLAVFGVFLLGLAAGLLVGRGLSAPAHRVLALVFVGLGGLLVLGSRPVATTAHSGRWGW